MQVNNLYGVMLNVVALKDGKPGKLRQVMPGIPQEVNGPAFMYDDIGRVVSYHTIPGQVTIINAGRHDPVGGVLLMPDSWQIVHEWSDHGICYQVVIEDFRRREKYGRGLS